MSETDAQQLERLRSESCVCQKCGWAQAEPNWCHRCRHRTSMPDWAKTLLTELDEVRAERDELRDTAECYWQALADIDGHENWEPKTMGDRAREALCACDPELTTG